MTFLAYSYPFVNYSERYFSFIFSDIIRSVGTGLPLPAGEKACRGKWSENILSVRRAPPKV